MHRFWIAAVALIFVAVTDGAALAAGRPMAALSDPRATDNERWSADESWSRGDAPIYTFNADGSFVSSNWNKGQSYGVWSRHGDAFVMVWPAYQVFYIGVIKGPEIEGDAYEISGDAVGTFKMHRLADAAKKTP